MALAPTNLGQLQKVGLALSSFADAADMFRGGRGGYANRQLAQLQALQQQFLMNQKLAQEQAKQSAVANIAGGLDPSKTAPDGTPIVWDTGRQAPTGLVHRLVDPSDDPSSPAGIANDIGARQGFQPQMDLEIGVMEPAELARATQEHQAGLMADYQKAYPEQFAAAQLKQLTEEPELVNYYNPTSKEFKLGSKRSGPVFAKQGFVLAENFDPQKGGSAQSPLGKLKSDLDAGLITPEAYRAAVAKENADAGSRVTWGNPVAEIGPDGKPIQVQYSNDGQRRVVTGATPAKQGNAFDRQDYWRGQFKPYLDSAQNASTQIGKVTNALALESGTGDIAAINALQKMVDEGGVVREQDVNLIQGAQSLLGTLKGRMKQLQDGDQLTPELRQEIAATAQALASGIYAGVQTRISPYTETMRTEGVTLENIVPEGLQKAYSWNSGGQAPPQGFGVVNQRPRATNAKGEVVEFDGTAWVKVSR